MGKIKEQVAALFGFKVRDDGDDPESEYERSEMSQHQQWVDDSQIRAKSSIPSAHISRIPDPAAKRTSAEQQSRLPAFQLPSPKEVSNSLPGRMGSGASSAITAPLQVESATLVKLSASQRSQILQELLKRLQTGPVSSRAAAAESLFNTTSEDETSRQSISEMGAVRPLVELLKLDDVKGQMYAAYTLSALTSFDSSLADMRECNAIEALLQLLNSNVSDVSKKGALRALGRLARVDECVIEMVELDAIPILSRLLDSSDGTIVRRCLLTLYFIGADKLDMQDVIAQSDIVQKVVALTLSKQHEIQSEAVDVIKVLARSEKCANIIMNERGIHILESIAKDGPNPKARTCAVKALQRLAEIEDARQHIIETGGQPLLEAQAGGSEAASLAAALKDGSDPEGQSSACQAVIDAIREDHTCAIHMADAGVTEALIPLLQSNDADTRDAVAVALAHIASHATARRRVWSAGAISPLVHGLSTLGFRGVEGAAVCLEKLVALKEAAEQLASEPVLPGLLHAIRMGHAQASYFALRTLFLLSGVDSSMLEQLSSPENLVLLSLRAWHGKPEAQSVALLLLRDLGRQCPKEVANIATGTVPLLMGLQSSTVPEVAQFAQETVQLLRNNPAVSEESSFQGAMHTFIEQLSTNPEMPLSRTCERALRMIPRGLYHSEVPEADAYSDSELSVLAGQVVEPASVDVLILQKLRLAPGQRFLEIGSGSGYLTALAAYMVGSHGSATGVDISSAAVDHARERCNEMHKRCRFGHGVPAPRFLLRDGGTLLEVGELWDAIVVSGNVPSPWIKTLTKLCSENGRLIACVDEQLCLFEVASSAKDGQIIGLHKFPDMTLSRRRKQPVQSARKSDGSPRRGAGRARAQPGAASGAAPAPAAKDAPAAPDRGGRSDRGSPVEADPAEGGLQPRLPGGSGLLVPEKENGKGGRGGEDAQMRRVKREIETEQMNGLLVTADDIEICRTPKGRKCRLGEGGFGVVYKALMNGVDEVAIKLVKAANPSAKEVEIFLTEVRTLSKLHHRNIVQFYGACLDPDRAMFFVTELMKGGDLYSALRHHPETMRWDKLGKKVALDVALGVNYLHSRRPPLLHRDLKSPNVLLSEEGVAKIADVGMVRSQVKELVTAQPVMTPLWAAPEVMRHERASVKADIWSFGILIWELVTGSDITEYQPLAQSRQPGRSQKGKQMVLPSQCPPVAQRVFRECTKADPDERPSSQDIVEWLRRG